MTGAERAQAHAERARRIYEARRAGGLTYAAMAREHGVTLERVRQIFIKEERRINRAVEIMQAKLDAGDDPGGLRLHDLELSVRAYNCVKAELGEEATLSDIAARSDAEWLRSPNFGIKSLKELRGVLASHGYTVGERRPGYLASKHVFGRVVNALLHLDAALQALNEELERGGHPEAFLDDLVEGKS